MRAKRDMSCHLVIGPLVLVCELDHFIQCQHTVVYLANRKGERERDKKGWRAREEEERERTRRRKGRRGFCTLDNFIQCHGR